MMYANLKWLAKADKSIFLKDGICSFDKLLASPSTSFLYQPLSKCNYNTFRFGSAARLYLEAIPAPGKANNCNGGGENEIPCSYFGIVCVRDTQQAKV